MNQYPSDGAGWRPPKILRQLQSPQANLARALRQLFLHLGIEIALRRSTGRKKRRLLPQVVAFAGDQFLVDKLRRRVLDQLLFFSELEIHKIRREA